MNLGCVTEKRELRAIYAALLAFCSFNICHPMPSVSGRLVIAPELNRRRATFVLGKIDEILAWEAKEPERDADHLLATDIIEINYYTGQPADL